MTAEALPGPVHYSIYTGRVTNWWLVAASALAVLLVVCPASLMGNWEAEIHRFAPGEPVRRFHGTSRDLTDAGGGFVLTTYGTLRSDTSTGGAHALAATAWDLVVADEAQHVKNPASATARGLRPSWRTARCHWSPLPQEQHPLYSTRR